MLLTPTTFTTLLLAASAVSAVPFGVAKDAGHASPTHTITTTMTKTATVTSGVASTAYAFKRGNPPPKLRRSDPLEKRAPQISSSSSSAVSVVADVGRPAPTSTLTVTTTHTTTTTPPTVTETAYPCSNSSILYGTASSSSNIAGTQNNLYGLDTPQGADVHGCCNTCLFDMENCVQAWWYFYEGCVVQQAVNVTEMQQTKVTGKESQTCPQGTIGGLTYGNDTDPAFRSTGNIVGPCGSSYVL